MSDIDETLDLPIPRKDFTVTDVTFRDLGLSEPIMHCLDKIGFEHPSPIQAAVIPHALQGRDLIGLAQTGSGKTAAFVLPVAEKLWHGKGLRGVILCPTREIALQTQRFLDEFGHEHGLKTACVIGGVGFAGQLKQIQKGADVVVATPGRLWDFISRGNVDLSHVTDLVLDEADHMFDLGFYPQVVKILSKLPPQRRTMMFTATMPQSIERLARQFLRDPVIVDILPQGKAATGITHHLYLVEESMKGKCLTALLSKIPDTTLIFVRTKLDADWIGRGLTGKGMEVAVLHSDRNMNERLAALSRFREGKVRILIATDIAARGLDIPSIGHVINFDAPDNVEDYIHRAGRTARAGRDGLVSTIATVMGKQMIRNIEKHISQSLERMEADGIPALVESEKSPLERRRRR